MYFKRDDLVFGPYADEQIGILVKAGRILSDSTLASEFDGPWYSLDEYRRQNGIGVYFCWQNGAAAGPFTESELKDALKSGVVNAKTPVGEFTTGPWKMLDEIFESWEQPLAREVIQPGLNHVATTSSNPTSNTWALPASVITAIFAVIGSVIGAGQPLEAGPLVLAVVLNPIGWLALYFGYLASTVEPKVESVPRSEFEPEWIKAARAAKENAKQTTVDTSSPVEQFKDSQSTDDNWTEIGFAMAIVLFFVGLLFVIFVVTNVGQTQK